MKTMEKETNTPDKKSSRRFPLGPTARLVGVMTLGVALIIGASAMYITASDHDDGELDTKGRNRNLTDLFVFREQDQRPGFGQGNLVFVMNTNPRSVARQQYYFSDTARYEFKITRVNDNDATPTGKEDITLRFEFDPPNNNDRQNFTLTALRRNGSTIRSQSLRTTPLNTSPAINNVSLGGSNLAVFAGLREDPFFFDVEQFFRVRAGARGIGPKEKFRSPNKARDFAAGYNVNAIAVRVPIKFLQGSTNAQTFDVWETISIQSGNGFKQFERLGRPAINEGLIVDNDLLNIFNSVPPSADLSPAAKPVRDEAVKTLLAFNNNNQAQVNKIAGAFLPDVMRIDTTGKSGYGNALNANGSPIRGRMLKDDVVDITLGVVTTGRIKTDNVSYNGASGNSAQGHNPLVNSFPYLAPAN